jgi:hypothetical protein
MNPNNFRDSEGNIDLPEFYAQLAEKTGMFPTQHGLAYLELIESIQPIRSRQAATVAVATALFIKGPPV